jgi:CubicO group peptidase (beta-lactamase class C family)
MLRTTLICILSALTLGASLAGAAAAAPTASTAPVPVFVAELLTRIYRGEDGGALYLRQQGNVVHGFGEHPGQDYAYVLRGTISGDAIAASWWDIPKGDRTTRGTIQLRWSQAGARIERTGGGDLGPAVYTAIPANGIPWPNRRAAGFQATRQNDLDGAFAGDDGSRHYFREVAGDVVGVAERGAQPEERPGWVTVFVGERNTGGTAIGGTYVDVPKGLESRSGGWGAAFVGTKRELRVEQTSVDRTESLTPEYAIDWDGFANEIAGTVWGNGSNVVGYAFAIAKNGGILRSGAGGDRRTTAHGSRLPFTTKTQAQTASAAKTINAAALIKVLYEHNLTVDSKIAPFLPSCWKRGPGVASITFRQILNHTSRLPLAGGKCNFGDGYSCLVEMIEKGQVGPLGDYNTHAYDLLRIFVPMVDDRAGTMGAFELHKCKNTAQVLNRKVSSKFVTYVFEEILDPAGAKASFYPEGDFSYSYDEDRRSLKGDRPQIDFYMRAGSGKLAMSVTDYIRFLSALDRGLIIPKGRVEMMKGQVDGNRLGFDSARVGAAGVYHRKTGGCPDFPGTIGGCKTVAMIFPGDVQVYVATNSDGNDYPGSLTSIVANAFDNALR